MQDSRRQFLAAAAAGVTGMLAGCGGSDTGTPTGTDGTATDEAATDGPATTETGSMATDTESGTAETATESEATATEASTPPSVTIPTQTVAVASDGFNFSPTDFEIAVGDTVQWEWEAGGHNVRPDDIPAGSDWTGTDGGDGETYGSGHTHSHTFEATGEYSYYCAPHQSAGMTGSFTVTE